MTDPHHVDRRHVLGRREVDLWREHRVRQMEALVTALEALWTELRHRQQMVRTDHAAASYGYAQHRLRAFLDTDLTPP